MDRERGAAEPAAVTARPIGMTRAPVVTALLASVVLAGCGSQEGTSESGSGEPGGDGMSSGAAASAWRDCTPEAVAALGLCSPASRDQGKGE